MWNPSKQPPNPEAEEDDSWEVRAFAEDTADAMGTTWPPRSYTCTFCRREFRSAQALGGHMNVHRRDRARLHQSQPSTSSVVSSFPVPSPSMAHPLLLPSRDFVASEGLWFQVYQQLPNPNNVDPASALLSVWPYNLPPSGVTMKYPQTSNSLNFSAQPPLNLPFHQSDQLEASYSSETSQETMKSNIKKSRCSSDQAAMEEEEEEEEIDLELRLGQSRPPL